MYKFSYLRKRLHKLVSIIILTCSTKLKEINGLLKNFSGEENKPSSEGDLIDILVNMAPAQWHKSTVAKRGRDPQTKTTLVTVAKTMTMTITLSQRNITKSVRQWNIK